MLGRRRIIAAQFYLQLLSIFITGCLVWVDFGQHSVLPKTMAMVQLFNVCLLHKPDILRLLDH
jgi:hypothetical protein